MPQGKSVRFAVSPNHGYADDGETSGANRTENQASSGPPDVGHQNSTEVESTTHTHGTGTALRVDQVIDEPLEDIEDEVVLSEHSFDNNSASLVRESNVTEGMDTSHERESDFHELAFDEERDGVAILTRIKHRKSDICRICHEFSGTELYTRVRDVPHLSINDETMRSLICLPEDDFSNMFNAGPLESPCLCKGTVGMVHRSCLERWLTEARRYTCELCGFRYETVRVPRLPVLTSFYLWICSPGGRGKMFLWDLLQVLVLIPLSVGSSYISMILIFEALFSARRCLFDLHRGQLLRDAPNCTWWRFASFALQSLVSWGNGFAQLRSIGPETWFYLMLKPLRLLLSLSSTTFLTVYLITMMLSLTDNFESWCRWRQADSVVRLLETPPEARVRVVAEVPSIIEIEPLI